MYFLLLFSAYLFGYLQGTQTRQKSNLFHLLRNLCSACTIPCCHTQGHSYSYSYKNKKLRTIIYGFPSFPSLSLLVSPFYFIPKYLLTHSFFSISTAGTPKQMLSSLAWIVAIASWMVSPINTLVSTHSVHWRVFKNGEGLLWYSPIWHCQCFLLFPAAKTRLINLAHALIPLDCAPAILAFTRLLTMAGSITRLSLCWLSAQKVPLLFTLFFPSSNKIYSRNSLRTLDLGSDSSL